MPLDSPDLTEFTTASPVLVNYNVTNILSGTAYQDYYLAQSKSTTSFNKIAVLNTYSSSSREFNIPTGVQYFDFPVINLHIEVFGTAIFQISFEPAADMNVTFTLVKSSGGVESDVGTAVVVNTPGSAEKKYLIQYPITTKVNFAKGDFIRLKILKSDAHNNYIGTDPANEAATVLPAGYTKSTISIPSPLPNQ